ncbi:unnamed protein product [Rodentolepis nana]|uniref:Uncharacterized protein n=1 Tax=Rodentolepis nana TaxID=102285 RepID=A0A0R3TVL5_RODNA|nr:unnamed protein product [Rodentolepis nana]
MSASDVLTGCSGMSYSQRTSLLIKFIQFFLFNSEQFPDYKLLSTKDIGSKAIASSDVSVKKLQSSIDSLRQLETELKSLSSSPVNQFLLILGQNIQKPSRMILLNFSNFCVNHVSSDEDELTEEDCTDFFRNIVQNPHFSKIFASAPPSRLHVFFRTDVAINFGNFIPKPDFNPLNRNCPIHLLNVISKEETMEISFEEPCADGSNGLSDKLEKLLSSDNGLIWYSCSKVVTGC